MSLTIDQVKKVAKLANLPITPTEEETYASQLSAIIEYIDSLENVDTSNVEPTYNISSRVNEIMEMETLPSSYHKNDQGEVEGKRRKAIYQSEPKDSLTQEQALQNAPKSKNGSFVTKGVFESE